MASILLIDDYPALRKAMREALRAEGYAVSEAANGRDGLALLRRQQADLVITDINMPEVDGFEVIHALKAEFPAIRIVAMSGKPANARLDLLEVAQQMGVWWTLRKPFDDGELTRVVRQALGERSERRRDPSRRGGGQDRRA